MADEQIANMVCRIHETPNYKQMKWCMPNHFLSMGLWVCLVSTSVCLSLYIKFNQHQQAHTDYPSGQNYSKENDKLRLLHVLFNENWKPNPRNALSHTSWSAPLQLCIMLFKLSFFFLFPLFLFLKNEIHIIIAIWFSCKPMAILFWINQPIYSTSYIPS